MIVKFRDAFRWYKKGQEVDVPRPVGKLWVSMRLVDVLDDTTKAVVETAELRQQPEMATSSAVPPVRRRRVRNEIQKPEGNNAAGGTSGDVGGVQGPRED